MSKAIPFEAIAVGQALGPVQTRITDKAVRAYCEDWEDPSPLYLEGVPGLGPITPPAFMAGLTGFQLLSTLYDTRATIGVKTMHENLLPVSVGQTMTTRGEIADKYVKRGLEYVVVTSTSFDEAGNAFRRSTDHILLSLERVA